MEDHRLRLRPVTDEDESLLIRIDAPEVAGPYNHFDDVEEEQIRASHVGAGRFIVERPDGMPVGEVTWFGVPYGPNRRSVAWKIGVTILPEHRRQGYGALAQRLLAAHLFTTTTVNRVEADTDVRNLAEQRALERAGFRREGIVRGAQYRAGAWHDLVMYGVTRGDLQG